MPAFQGPQLSGPDGTACRAYDCYLLRQFDPQAPLEAQAELLPIEHRVAKVRSSANRHFEPSGRFVLPASPVYMMPIQHWSCLMAANLLGMPGFFLRSLRQRPAAAASLPGRMVWRAGSLRPTRLLAKLYLAGRRCRVDASAHIEAAILDSRVKVGPNAVIRGCVIGSGATIGAGAVLEGCTIGPGATVNPNVVARCCVIGSEANLGAFFTQLSVLGDGAVLCPDSGFLDFSFRNSVPVDVQGATVPCGSQFLGGCLGDRAFLGPGLKLTAGQEIANDCVLVENPLPAWFAAVDNRCPSTCSRSTPPADAPFRAGRNGPPECARRGLSPPVQPAAVVEVVDQHFAHVAAGIDQHPLDAVPLADRLQAVVEPLARAFR